MPEGSGVRLAVATVSPHVIKLPPAISIPGMSRNWGVRGVWHPLQLPILARYEPCSAGVERFGSGTGSVTGCGTDWKRRDRRNGTLVGSNLLRTGGNVRTKTTTEATSSSDIWRKLSYGITGSNTRPSSAMPSRMARAMASSLHLPRPDSGSEVMLGATTEIGPSWKRAAPAPSFETGTGRSPFLCSAFSSYLAWHPMHLATACTRYSPRRMRSAVGWNLRAVKGRVRAPITVRQPTVKVMARERTTNKTNTP